MGTPLFLSDDNLKSQVQKWNGKIYPIDCGIAHPLAAEICNLLHLVNGCWNIPIHCGQKHLALATDLLCSDNLPIYNQNWKNGTTYQITGEHIHSIPDEAQSLGIKKVGNIPVIIHLK